MTNDPVAFTVFNEIGIINQLVSTLFDKVLPADMTRAQFTVLNHFVRLNIAERSPAQLASAFQLTRPTMTSTLARMERHGLIKMVPDPADGRGKLVSLTDKGRATREACVAAMLPLAPLLNDVVDEAKLHAMLPDLVNLRMLLDTLRP